MSPLSSDNRIGHFRIVGRLGEGGMGVVYRARDEQLARDVAVKVLPAERLGDPTARARLLREARSAAALNHPHICGVYEVGEEQGEAYIAMELVEGRPLSGILAAGALAPADVARYGMQLADALAHAHSRGIVHRDLKSANVVVNDDDRAKVLDFGLAKPFAGVDGEEATRTGVSLTEVGVVSGTLAYMAPEQFRGLPADARSDIWALGIVLHEMAAGDRPFQGETGFALSSAILNAPPAPLPASVPVELRAVVARCLEKDPARRYQSAGDVSAALQAIQAGTTSAWVAWQYRLTRSAYAPVALLALAVLLVAGYLGREWLRVRFGGAPRPPSVAVLPLENLSSDPEQDYLADAVHEGIISDLSDIKGLRVIQRASLRRYRDTRKSPSEVARELGGVDSIVTGAILPAGNRVRLTVHLMRASDEQPLWDGKYDHELTDVLTLQNQVTNAIAGELKIRLAPEHADRLAKPARKVNPATYDLVARARFHAHKNTPEGFEKAIAYLTQAVQDDPREPLAWSSLAMIYSLMAHEGVPGMQEKAGPPARRAIELDPTLAEAHQALGETKAYADRNLQGAQAEYQEALRLKPNLPEAHAQYAWYLKTQGRHEAQLLEMRQAQALDPLDPLYLTWLAEMCTELERHDEALELTRRALDMNPDYVSASVIQVLALRGKGRHQDAIDLATKLAAKEAWTKPVLARALIGAGRLDEATRLVAEARTLPPDVVGAWHVLNAYVELGDNANAIAWIETMIARQHIFCSWIDAHLALSRANDALRADPRYKTAMARIKPSV